MSVGVSALQKIMWTAFPLHLLVASQTTECYSDGTPCLQDSQCQASYPVVQVFGATVSGGEIYAYSVPGYSSGGACCKSSSATQCNIKTNLGTFPCTRQNTVLGSGVTRCTENGSPGLTNSACQTSYSSTGRNFVFSIPSAGARQGCCGVANATQCITTSCTIQSCSAGPAPATTSKATMLKIAFTCLAGLIAPGMFLV